MEIIALAVTIIISTPLPAHFLIVLVTLGGGGSHRSKCTFVRFGRIDESILQNDE